jgi:hypothetical protein
VVTSDYVDTYFRGDRCRRDFCGVNNREDRWFEYACRLREARTINSLCQIDAPKAAVKRALSESGIGMFGTGLTTQTTNDDSAPSSCEDWMPLVS